MAKDEKFRDSLSTVDKEGGRVWVYPKKPSGKYHTARAVVSTVLLAFLFGMPFLSWNGNPLMLFDIINRKFIVFGAVFRTQDFYIFALIFLTMTVFVVLFTVVFGRIFCGWICPQTIFLEMVFRKIEYWIEGDHNKQKALDKAPWTRDKIIKKTSKHIIFFVLSVAIANTFLAYIIGIEQLKTIVTGSFSEHKGGFAAMVTFSIVFYWVFAKFREQVCTIACPYGRLQGVLLDQNSVVVAYDNLRGEPRGLMRKNEERAHGDCIDCKLCVQVCPTNIDIRNGTQLECINCTACIDACDDVMIKIDKPIGLIRYDSLKGIEEKQPFKFTPRIIAYTVVLSAMLLLVGALLFTRSDIDVTVLRARGVSFQRRPDGSISNLYNIKIINKKQEAIAPQIRVLGHKGASIEIVGGGFKVPSEGIGEGAFFVIMPAGEKLKPKSELELGFYDQNGLELLKTETSFMSPF